MTKSGKHTTAPEEIIDPECEHPVDGSEAPPEHIKIMMEPNEKIRGD